MDALKRIEELEVELEGRKELARMIEGDFKAKQEAFKSRLQSALKFEYEDFKSAEGMTMNEDLGENMRIQLQNIFDILNDAGIKMDV